ncbi:AsmA family protein [Algoriphagus chordae]|uniref:AsmA-like protein n=1 Tax=Algoriphagus chordae TaxID=237019 RepID=A0A2W7RG18_9BACT|nr:hypothetical protein [Algoriphagus chordae]PZX58056.1 hypothetical protein LV85_00242 [Algoriphagus chordae]
MKKLFIILGSIIFLLAIGITGLKYWVQNNFESRLNSNPDRKYDLNYENFTISILAGNIELDNLKITPLNTDSLPSVITGTVEKAELDGISFLSFITAKAIKIQKLSFLTPDFTVIHSDFPKKSTTTTKPFQSLFKDIISRGEIKNFSLLGGKAELLYQKDTLQKIGSFEGLEIIATGLVTDSVQVGRAIPFKLENITISLKNFSYLTTDGQTLSLGAFDFDLEKGQMDLEALSMKLNSTWEEYAKTQPVQKGIMSFDIGHLALRGLSSESQFYDSLMVISQSLEIDSLDLHVSKDKNRPLPPQVAKKDFSNMLEELSFPVAIDSLLIKNSKITYSEIESGKTKAGTITLSEVNGLIQNVSSIDAVEKEKPLLIAISAIFDGSGKLNLNVTENYFERKWVADLTLEAMDMKQLNQTVNHLAGISIVTGDLQKLHMKMEATATASDNHFLMQYKDLKMELINPDDHKKGFMSSVANLAIHKQHLPGDKNYQELTYSTTRDIYKGPINLIWLSAKDGLMATIPSKVVQKLLPHSKESKAEKQEEKKDKKEIKAEKKAERKAKNN